MASNKDIVRASAAAEDKATLAPFLAEDVEWVEWGDGVPPSGVITRGRDAFIANYGPHHLRTEISRLTEEGDVVVAEGTTYVTTDEGESLTVRFCNIFELEDGLIKRKSSFGVLLDDSA